jgi:hypothetical protein
LARNFGPETVGGLRVPAIIEWPKGVKPRVTMHPARILDAARAFATCGVQD